MSAAVSLPADNDNTPNPIITLTVPSAAPAPVPIGIDLAKTQADVMIGLDPEHPIHHRVPHADVPALLAEHIPDHLPRLIAMEYSGGLALPLLLALETDPRNELMIVNDTDTRALRDLLRRPRKTDRLDADLICRMMFIARDPHSRTIINNHLTPWSTLRPAILRRHAVRHLQALTRDRTRLKLRLQRAQTELARDHIQRLIAAHDTLIEEAKAELENVAASDPQAQLLTTIPGITPRKAAIILAAIGEIERFETPDRLVRYLGLQPPHTPTSNGQPVGPRLRKRASDLLATELFMWSLVLARRPASYAGWGSTYLRFKGQESARRGMWTVQRKLIRTIWHVLTTGQPFDPDRTLPRGQIATEETATAPADA